VLTVTAVQLLTLPYLKIIGAILLLYIGVQLLADSGEEEDMDAHSNIWGAIRTILAIETGDRPLLGTGLLNGLRMEIDFVEGGRVAVSKIG